MGTVFSGWLNANESRKYPLHDAATKQSSDGSVLPDDILADMQLLVPLSAGRYVFISSLSVTAGLVSLTVLATDEDPLVQQSSSSSSSARPLVPIAAISVRKPVELYKNYQVSALYPGVAGWVAFGSGVEELSSNFYRFESPIDGLLAPRAAKPYLDYPVTSVGSVDRLTALTGLVSLQGSSTVNITKAVRTIGGRRREVIALGLVLGESPKDVLHSFAGECLGRPDERTCPGGKPLRFINGVAPDRDGNIDIVFEGIDATMVKVDNGAVVDLPVGLDDVCTPFDPSRYDPADLCASSSSAEPEESSSSPSASSVGPEPEPPTQYYDNFEDAAYTAANLEAQKGTWEIHSVPPSEAILEPRRMCALDRSIDNVMIHPRIHRMAALGYHGFVTIRPYNDGANGHLVFAHKGDDDFWYAGVSIRTDVNPLGMLYVGHKTGDLGSTLDNWPLGLEAGYQFDTEGGPNAMADPSLFPGSLLGMDVRVEVFVRPQTAGTLLEVRWYWSRVGQGLPDPTTQFNTASFMTNMDLSGHLGMGAVAAEAHFDNFGIFDLP